MTQPSMTTSETLNKAADLIAKRGWVTGEGWENIGAGGPLCLEGGIAAAMGMDNALTENVNGCPAYRAVREYLGMSPFIFNDGLPHAEHGWVGGSRETAHAYGREQVIATLRAAALIEAAKETAADPLVAHLAHHAVDIIAAELDTTAAPL